MKAQGVSQLQYLSLLQRNIQLFALIDSGAQVNLISEHLCSALIVKDKFKPDIRQLRGMGGATTTILYWALIPFTFENGHIDDFPFAIIQGNSTLVIFGLPGLKQLNASINHALKYSKTPFGPIPLYEQRKDRASPYITSVNLSEVEEKSISDILSKAKVTEDFKQQLKELLLEYQDLWINKRRGVVQALTHRIRLDTKYPIASRARVHTEEHNQAIDKEIQKMLQDGVIVPSESPYSSEIVMVKKKTGDWRMCIDYRPLNKRTIGDAYNLPRIPELLRSVQNSKYFIALDLRSGYWQIPMDPESRQYTAFRSKSGLFEFTVMPFGLKNAPATFQRCMDFLLSDLKNNNVSVYIDDILIHHSTPEGCLTRLKTVFQRFRAAGITINLDKSQFFQEELEYLGHFISNGYIKPNQKKVEALNHINQPKTVHDIRSVLGMVGYFQSFIPYYSKIVLPITALLKERKEKNSPIEWTNTCQRALDQCITALKKATLTIPLENDEFKVHTDASEFAIGGVLLVKRNESWQPVHFVSKKLSGSQLNWPIREKEAYAIIHCLSKFDSLIRSRHFIVATDNQSLKWLFEAPSGKLARWAVLLSEYDMEIEWCKGSSNVVADFLSRHIDFPDPVKDYMCYNLTVDTNPSIISISTILNAYLTEPKPVGRGYIFNGDLIYYNGLLWVPPKLRTRVIAACHLLPPYCHPGTKRTAKNILKVFNWPYLHRDVGEYIQSCLTCQRLRRSDKPLSSYPHNPLDGPFAVLHIDFWSCTYQGQSYTVLTMIDAFTRWAEAEVMKTHVAEEVASAILKNWICRFGCPRRLVSDNEMVFNSSVLTKLHAALGVHHISTVPYRPQGNAPIEAFHKHLNRMFNDISLLPNIPIKDALPLALYRYRTLIHTSTHESPAFMLYGCDMRPIQPFDWRFREPSDHDSRIQYLSQVRKDILDQALRLRMYKMSEEVKQPLKIGELVLAPASSYEVQRHQVQTKTSLKLIPKWTLPARVIQTFPVNQRAIIKYLLTGVTREVHIIDLRVIKPPIDIHQRKEWGAQLSKVLHPDHRSEFETTWLYNFVNDSQMEDRMEDVS